MACSSRVFSGSPQINSSTAWMFQFEVRIGAMTHMCILYNHIILKNCVQSLRTMDGNEGDVDVLIDIVLARLVNVITSIRLTSSKLRLLGVVLLECRHVRGEEGI